MTCCHRRVCFINKTIIISLLIKLVALAQNMLMQRASCINKPRRPASWSKHSSRALLLLRAMNYWFAWHIKLLCQGARPYQNIRVARYIIQTVCVIRIIHFVEKTNTKIQLLLKVNVNSGLRYSLNGSTLNLVAWSMLSWFNSHLSIQCRLNGLRVPSEDE